MDYEFRWHAVINWLQMIIQQLWKEIKLNENVLINLSKKKKKNS